MFRQTLAALALLSAATFGSTATAATLTIDGDTSATGSGLGGAPLVTALGTVTYAGEFLTGCADPDFVAAGATGACFDVLDSNTPSVLTFDFAVETISFLYGGNLGDTTVQALDSDGDVVSSFFQQSTGIGFPAGPETLGGGGIFALGWFDTAGSFAPLDNIVLTTTAPIPLPAGLPLIATALAALGFLRRRRG